MKNEVAVRTIDEGNASRFIKPRWLNADRVLTLAFDLRDAGNPPETYVSHFIADGDSLPALFESAYENISKRIKKCEEGSIALLDISEALLEVNDETFPLIEFVDKNLPHCGLIYVTSAQEKIQEAKATLCVLAAQKLKSAQTIKDQMKSIE